MGENIFDVAVSKVVPAAIAADNEESDKYAIGNIIYNSVKPTIVSWSKQRIQFALKEDSGAVDLKSILTPDCARHLDDIQSHSTLLSSTGNRETTRKFSTKFKGTATTVKAGFGAIYQKTSNLMGIFDSTSGKLKADFNNLTVQKILQNGGHFFVLSTLYEAEKVDISVSEDTTTEEETLQWRNVVSKSEKTVLGFLIIKLSINISDGVIEPVWHGGYTPTSLSINESNDGTEIGGEFEDVDSDYLYKHHQYGRREIQLFQSDSYAGVIEEAAAYVKALNDDNTLKAAFIKILQKPGTLLKLSQDLHTIHKKLVTESSEGVNEIISFQELLAHISTPSPHSLDQLKALIIATEAFKELSPVTTKRILSLTSDEKETLFLLFKQLPLGHSAHTFPRPPFSSSDSLYELILEKIGFGETGCHLSYQTDDSSVDLVAVVITAIQAVIAH